MSFLGPLRHEGARTSLPRWWRRPRTVVPAPPEGGAGRSWGAAPEGGDCTDEAGARPHAREVVARRLHRRLLVLPGRAAALAGPRAGATTDLGGPDDGRGGRRARDPVPVQPAEPGAGRAARGSASPRRGASAGVHRLPGDGRDLQRTEPRGLPPVGAGPRRHGRALRLPPRLRRRVPLGGAAVPGRAAAGPRERPPTGSPSAPCSGRCSSRGCAGAAASSPTLRSSSSSSACWCRSSAWRHRPRGCGCPASRPRCGSSRGCSGLRSPRP